MLGVGDELQWIYAELHYSFSPSTPFPALGLKKGPQNHCPSSEAEVGYHGDMLCFPTVWLYLTSSNS